MTTESTAAELLPGHNLLASDCLVALDDSTITVTTASEHCAVCNPTRDTAAPDGITTHADDERRRLGIPRTRETPCAVDGCDVTSPLHRVNPKGDLGIFMCPEHARRIG